jgi:hypothetical protein
MTSALPQPVRTWQEISQQAFRETDPKKFAVLVEELERSLDERDKLATKPVPLPSGQTH